MARKKAEPDPNPPPIGPLVAKNLKRLGYVEETVKVTAISQKIEATTGRKFSRQRVSQILNAVRVEQATLDLLAKGLGVKVSELTRDE